MVLRHCVYSRYASLKNPATTCIFIGQESLGHPIDGFGQGVGDWFVAPRSAMDVRVWAIDWFLLAQWLRNQQGLHLKQSKSEFITTNQSSIWLGTCSETSYETHLRSLTLSNLACVLLWVLVWCMLETTETLCLCRAHAAFDKPHSVVSFHP